MTILPGKYVCDEKMEPNGLMVQVPSHGDAKENREMVLDSHGS